MKVVCIIQARMGSTRLPGKVLRTLKDHSVLGHVIERLKKVGSIDQLVVATTTLSQDDAIIEEANIYGIATYRGSEQDVLSRYYEAAKEHEADIVVRVTSDCPLIEPEVVSSVIELLISSGADYASNALVRFFPRGLDVECFTMNSLTKAFHEGTQTAHREHVTPYIYQNPQLFKITDFINDIDYSNHRWTLDTIEDWHLIEEIYNTLYQKGKVFHWLDVIQLMKDKPELMEINAHIEQKKLTSN